MERTQNLKKRLRLKRTGQTVWLIVLFHLIGLIGLSFNVSRPLFLQLVPFHLLFMMVLIASNHERINNKFLLFSTLVFITGFVVEWIGIHTHFIFGDYRYGKTLGPRLDDIPVIIGLNWLLLIYSAGTLMQQTRIKTMWLRILTGTLVLVLLDVVIEPVAVKFDYWHWAGDFIPLKNYACWFIVSFILLWVFEKFQFKKQGIAGAALLITEFVFFLALQ
jgi:putative membrane protein